MTFAEHIGVRQPTMRYPFGLHGEAVAAWLRDMADNIDARTFCFQSAEERSSGILDDFVMETVTFTFARRNPHFSPAARAAADTATAAFFSALPPASMEASCPT